MVALVCGLSRPGWADLTNVDGTAYPMRYRGREVVGGSGGLFKLDFQDPAGTNVDAWGLNQDAYTPPTSGAPQATVRFLAYDTSALWGVDANDSSGDGGFLSLCLEKTETVPTMSGVLNLSPPSPGTTNAVEGSEGPGGSDPICKATAWLYMQFASGRLANFDKSVADVTLLQETLWWLEEEPGQAKPTDTTYLAAARDALDPGGDIDDLPDDLYHPAVDKDTGPFTVATYWGPDPDDVLYVDHYEVYVINCTNDGDLMQDYPILIASRLFGITPEPISMVIWGIGLCLFGLGIRRR